MVVKILMCNISRIVLSYGERECIFFVDEITKIKKKSFLVPVLE